MTEKSIATTNIHKAEVSITIFLLLDTQNSKYIKPKIHKTVSVNEKKFLCNMEINVPIDASKLANMLFAKVVAVSANLSPKNALKYPR